MEDTCRTRESRVLREAEPSRLEDELWQRAYERLVPRLYRRRIMAERPEEEPDRTVAGRVMAQGA